MSSSLRRMTVGALSIFALGGWALPAYAQSAEFPTPESMPSVTATRPTLQVGSQGSEVSQLQALLQLLGYYTDPVDGIYQQKTAIAVSDFQSSVGLTVDGIMGAETWSRLLPSVEDLAQSTVAETPGTPEPEAPGSELQPVETQSPPSDPETPPASTTDFPSPTLPPEQPALEQPIPEQTPPPSLEEASPEDAAPEPRPESLPESTSESTPTEPAPPSLEAAPSSEVSEEETPEATPSEPLPESTPTEPAPREATPASDVEAPPDTTLVDLPILRVGMQGSAVERLQERLRALGFFSGVVDGVFGLETKAAVEAAQRNYDLYADGVVGPVTWAALLR